MHGSGCPNRPEGTDVSVPDKARKKQRDFPAKPPSSSMPVRKVSQRIIRIGGRGIDCDDRIIIFSENGEVDRLVTRYQNKIRI